MRHSPPPPVGRIAQRGDCGSPPPPRTRWECERGRGRGEGGGRGGGGGGGGGRVIIYTMFAFRVLCTLSYAFERSKTVLGRLYDICIIIIICYN